MCYNIHIQPSMALGGIEPPRVNVPTAFQVPPVYRLQYSAVESGGSALTKKSLPLPTPLLRRYHTLWLLSRGKPLRIVPDASHKPIHGGATCLSVRNATVES